MVQLLLSSGDRMTEVLPAHSPLGPSSAKRWMSCPGSVRATANIPDVPKEYSAQGTLAHTIAEMCRDAGVRAEVYAGQIHEVETFTFTVDQEMVDGVNGFLDYVFMIGGEWHNELRIHYDQWVKHGFGTSDHITVKDGWLHVIDLKYGEGVKVFADDPQLKIYALGFIHDYGWLYSKFKGVRLHVYQPRLDHIDTADTTVNELIGWADSELRMAALRTEDEDAPFKSGDWCTFCKIRKTCVTRAQTVLQAMTDELDDIDKQIELIPRTPKPSQQMYLTNDQLAKLWRLRALAVKWWEDLDDQVRRQLFSGQSVGDLKLVNGKGSRFFKVSDDEVLDSLELEGYKRNDLMTKPEVLSVAQMESIVGKKNEIFLSMVKKKDGAPTVALGSDKRTAIPKIDVMQEFDAINPGGGDDE